MGGVHGDAVRNIVGSFTGTAQILPQGAFLTVRDFDAYMHFNAGTANDTREFQMSAARVVPTAAKNQPRAWGALACAYLGQPSS